MSLDPDTIERWRAHLGDWHFTPDAADWDRLLHGRESLRPEISHEVAGFRTRALPIDKFHARCDEQIRDRWQVFGDSRQAWLSLLARAAGDGSGADDVVAAMRDTLAVPADVGAARSQIGQLKAAWSRARGAGPSAGAAEQQAAAFLSTWWHAQDARWPGLSRPVTRTLTRDGLYRGDGDGAADYAAYVELLTELASALGIQPDELEGLCTWLHDARQVEAAETNAGSAATGPGPTARARRRVWLISPGEQARLWDQQRAAGVIAIGWRGLGGLSQYRTVADFNAALRPYQKSGRNPRHQANACYEFAHGMQPGDLVLVKRGMYELLGVGLVTGGYRHEPERAEYTNERDVYWFHDGSWTSRERAMPRKTLTDITDHSALRKHVERMLGESLDALVARAEAGDGVDVGGAAVASEARGEITDRPGADLERGRAHAPADDPDADRDDGLDEADEPDAQAGRPYTKTEALRDLFLSRAELDRVLVLLRRKRNLVLQGPPGVGKTFLAAQLSRLLIGSRTEDNVVMVQFHPSMDYEDFVRGYRPTSSGGLSLRDGPFVRLCDAARLEPDRAHVMFIDELHRGDLSRILGELILLIEGDKRGASWAASLRHADDDEPPFWVPPNVYLIGTMNTADRSRARMDYALRRRFAFVDVEPRFAHPAFRRHLKEREVEPRVIDWITARMAAINDEIRADAALGRGFEIGHSYFCGHGDGDEAWYADVIETEVLPLLREYWAQQPDRVERARAELLRDLD